MKDQIGDVAEFHKAAGFEVGQGGEVLLLRKELCEEEGRELALELGWIAPPWVRMSPGCSMEIELEKMVKEAVDLAYVAIGTVKQLIGEDAARRVWDEVHRSNMDKFPGGVAIRNACGKILKPDGWRPPDVAGAIAGTLAAQERSEVTSEWPMECAASIAFESLCEYELNVLDAIVSNRPLTWGAAVGQAIEALRGRKCLHPDGPPTVLGQRVNAIARRRGSAPRCTCPDGFDGGRGWHPDCALHGNER